MTADSVNTAYSDGESVAGGAITITGSHAENYSDQSTRANLGAGAKITAKSVSLQATNKQTMDTKSEALSFGLATGASALGKNTAIGDAKVGVGAGAEITAVNINVVARNAFPERPFRRQPAVGIGLPVRRDGAAQ
ncbi:hypothetical protein LP419_39670 [Massilia sp. H-1]|nr:hypothetical protein LP419_39670 [Massilia sp. H-1]